MPDYYNSVFGEHFDMTHMETVDVLTSIEESDKNKILDSLASKLYDKIVDKVDNIDFGSIPETRGDITKLENYQELLETIDIVSNIVSEYQSKKADCIDVIVEAIENVKDRTDLWQKAYVYDMALPIIFYNTIVLSIVSSVSLLIATSIDFIKDPGNEDYQIKFDKIAYNKTKENLLFNNLSKFNIACKKGEIDKSFEYILKNNNISKQLVGVDDLGIVSGIAIVGIVTLIIPILRELIFFFYHSRQRVSDYFIIQSELIQMNAEYVKNNPNLDAKTRKNIAKKQEGYVKNFRKIGNVLAIKSKTSDKKAKSEADKESREYSKLKINDVIDIKPDSYDSDNSNSSSLF